MNRKKSTDYTRPVTLVILLVLAIAGSRSPNAFKPLPSTQLRDDSIAPAFQDDGPSTDGMTTLMVTNSIPHPLVFMIQQNNEKKETRLGACQSCKIYTVSSEIPKDICKSGTKQTIAVQPGKNYAHWYHQTDQIGEIKANWNLPAGHKYSICLVMNLSKGRTDWDSKWVWLF